MQPCDAISRLDASANLQEDLALYSAQLGTGHRRPLASRWPQGNTGDQLVGSRGAVDIDMDIVGADIEVLRHEPNEFAAQIFDRSLFQAIAVVGQGDLQPLF